MSGVIHGKEVHSFLAKPTCVINREFNLNEVVSGIEETGKLVTWNLPATILKTNCTTVKEDKSCLILLMKRFLN